MLIYRIGVRGIEVVGGGGGGKITYIGREGFRNLFIPKEVGGV